MSLSPVPPEHVRVPRVSRALQAVAVGLLALIVGVTVQQLARQRSLLLEEVQGEIDRLDVVLAEQGSRAIDLARVMLRDFADELRLPPGQRPPFQGTLGERMERRIQGIEPIGELLLVDAAGTVVASSDAPVATPQMALPAAGLVLLAQLRAAAEDALLVSAPYHEGTNGWRVLVGRRFRGPDGRFGGIVAAALNLSYFEQFYQAVRLDPEASIALRRSDGTLLAAWPPENVVSPPSELDAASALVATQPLRGLPMTITLSVPVDSVLAVWRHGAAPVMLVALAAAAVIGALLLLLAHESQRVEGLVVENSRARAAAEAANRQLTWQMEERERTEATLRQAQRLEAVGQLTGGVAHDFNNLLTVLLGNIDLMQARLANGRPGADPGAAQRLERMREAAERGARLTDQLLAFARRQPLMPRSASLSAVVAAMTELIRSAVGSNVRLETVLAEAPWPVLVDATQLELVLLNLALNARDAMPLGGTLRIETTNVAITADDAEGEGPGEELAPGDYVAVRVTDSGAGMSEEVRAKAFEPFFTTKCPGEGSGMGLSQVYGFARQSGGGARIESAPGHGTTVSVFLPRAMEDTRPARPAGGASGGAITRGAQLLLVDDDEAVRATTTLVLDAIGYRILEASSAAAAIALVEQTPDIDVVLTDVAMPGMNGAELAGRLRRLRPDLPVVFVSGYADPAAVAGHPELRPLVRKPFRATDLAAAIEEALSERSPMAPAEPGE
jgi:signal transduction histidine kinase/ActR/RegA family two-component response regulator